MEFPKLQSPNPPLTPSYLLRFSSESTAFHQSFNLGSFSHQINSKSLRIRPQIKLSYITRCSFIDSNDLSKSSSSSSEDIEFWGSCLLRELLVPLGIANFLSSLARSPLYRTPSWTGCSFPSITLEHKDWYVKFLNDIGTCCIICSCFVCLTVVSPPPIKEIKRFCRLSDLLAIVLAGSLGYSRLVFFRVPVVKDLLRSLINKRNDD